MKHHAFLSSSLLCLDSIQTASKSGFIHGFGLSLAASQALLVSYDL
jgi:hypothetical protein